MTASEREVPPSPIGPSQRRWIARTVVALLFAVPLGVFWLEVGGIGHYFGSAYPPGQGAYIMMRAAGHVALVLLFIQVALGPNVRSIARWLGVPSLLRVHMSLGLTTLAFALLHPVLFLWARTLRAERFEPLKVFFPPTGDYYHNRLFLGAVGLYLLVVAIGAGAYGPRIAPRLWRRVHMLNYGVFIALWYHAVSIGSETRHPVLIALYGAMLGAVVFLAVRRVRRAWTGH